MSEFEAKFGVKPGEAVNVEVEYPDVPRTEIPFRTPDNSEDAMTWGNTHGGALIGMLALIQIVDADTGEVLGGNHWRVSCFVTDDGIDPVSRLRAGTGKWANQVVGSNRIWLLPSHDYILRLQPRKLRDGVYLPVNSIGGNLRLIHTSRDGNEEFYGTAVPSPESQELVGGIAEANRKLDELLSRT